MSEVSFFLKKSFFEFPKLRLGRIGKWADICIQYFLPVMQYNVKSKASELKQMNWKAQESRFP